MSTCTVTQCHYYTHTAWDSAHSNWEPVICKIDILHSLQRQWKPGNARSLPLTWITDQRSKRQLVTFLTMLRFFFFFLIQARRDFCDAGLILQIRKPSPGVGSRLFLAKVSQHQIFHLPLPQADLPASMLSSFISDRPSVCGAEQVSSMLERGKVIHQQSLSYRYHTHQSLP